MVFCTQSRESNRLQPLRERTMREVYALLHNAEPAFRGSLVQHQVAGGNVDEIESSASARAKGADGDSTSAGREDPFGGDTSSVPLMRVRGEMLGHEMHIARKSMCGRSRGLQGENF